MMLQEQMGVGQGLQGGLYNPLTPYPPSQTLREQLETRITDAKKCLDEAVELRDLLIDNPELERALTLLRNLP